MTNFFNFLFDHGLAIFVGVLPLTMCLVLSWFATSWRRWFAILLALIAGFVFAFEVYSGSLQGNLTGLIWMMTAPFIVVAMAILSVIEWSTRRTIHSKLVVPAV